MTIESIKTATKAAIGACGGLDASATVVRVNKTALSDYQNRHSPKVVPVDVAAALDQCAQEPLILSAMATAEGYAIVALSVGEGCVAKSMEQVAARAGETMATAMRVFADGVLDDCERAELDTDLAELAEVVGRARAVLRGPAAVSLQQREKAL